MPELSSDADRVPTDLAFLGWSSDFAEHLVEGEGLRPARVASALGIRLIVWTEDGPRMAAVRSRATRNAPIQGAIVVGDWVLVAKATEGGDEVVVERVLPRKTVFLRQAAGERSEPQAIAANIDRVLIVTSLEGDFNLRRLERYLLAIRSGGAEPVVVLSKADLCAESAQAFEQASSLAACVMTSARTGHGIDELRAMVPRGTTVALAGSSGVGKSALVNELLGHTAQTEGAVREHDKRGRHTTTRRSLFVLPSGGLLVDTPGMRELTPWYADTDRAAEASDRDTFADVEALAASCRYRDCTHAAEANEPGCAVREAVEAGRLDRARYDSFHKLGRERAERRARQDGFTELERNRRQRSQTTALRRRIREKG